MPKVITCANQKGGVGKSMVSFHLAYYFAEKGFSVALMDFDTQANTTSLFPKKENISHISTTDLTQKVFENEDHQFEKNNIKIFPATDSLLSLKEKELNLVIQNLMLNIQKMDVDFIIVDTPPALGAAHFASIFISNYVISPIQLRRFSIKGVNDLIKTITMMIEGQKKAGIKPTKFLGLLVNQLKRNVPDQIDSLNRLSQDYGDYVIPEAIGERQNIERAIEFSMPIWHYKRKDQGTSEVLKAIDYIYIKIMEGDK